MKICFVTGSRADYGLLCPIMNGIKMNNFFELQLIVTGTHLMEKYGSTYRMIINDGYNIDAYVSMNIKNDKPVDIVNCMGTELIQLSNTLDKLKPDIVVILGDRYEILIVATACLIFKIPVAHFCGGNITEGAYDDSIRHAITKLSDIHFVTDVESEKIVRQLGETNVIVTGNPGLEEFYYFVPISKNDLNIKLHDKNMLVLFHPETLHDDTLSCVKKLRTALEKYDGHKFIFRSNADNDNNVIYKELQGINNATYIGSLERKIYLSLAYYCDIFIGNSSSGIFEIPLLNNPIVINIGDRQKGRKLASNIIDCPDYNNIYDCILETETIKKPYKTYYEPINSTDIVISYFKKYIPSKKKIFNKV